MLTEVRLYGHLAKKFGKVHHFALRTPAQAMTALSVNLPEFRQYLMENSAPGYYVIVGKNRGLTEEDLTIPREMPVLKIVPGVQGRKAAGGFQMILGAVLMIVGAIGTFTPWGQALGGAKWGPFLMKVGFAMFVGGLSNYLSQPPDRRENGMEGRKQSSYAFDGPENTMAQGGPVPVVYGMLGVGSTLAAAAIYVEEITLGGTGEIPDDDRNTGEYHIVRPRLETVHTVDPDYPEFAVADSITVWAGTPGESATPPYTFTVENSADLVLGDNGHSLKAEPGAHPTGRLPIGNYSCLITCTDSTPDTPMVCTKEISYVVRTEDMDPGSASMYFPGGN